MSADCLEIMNQNSVAQIGTQNSPALLALMAKTGYSLIQENRQRRFGGPPPGWEGPPPPQECEVFVGKVPRDMLEDELVPVFGRAGRIYEFRLLMHYSGENRGYAFVRYTNKDEALLAIRMLNNYEIRPGRFIIVYVSLNTCKLYIGNIPQGRSKEDILADIRKVTEGVIDVVVYQNVTDEAENQPFAFAEFVSHRAAAMARLKLIPGTYQPWDPTVQVEWERQVTMQRRKVYVGKLKPSTLEETIKAEFNKFMPGSVRRVKKIRNFAFVYFFTREDAHTAALLMNGKCIDGARIEVSLAKHVQNNASWRQPSFGQMSFSIDSLNTFASNEEGSPRFYGIFRSPATVLDDQSRPLYPEPEWCTYPLYSGSMYCLNYNHFHPAVMELEHYCYKNNMAFPEYYLYSTTGPQDIILLVFKVALQFVGNNFHTYFMPDKLCISLEDAKELAAHFTLMQLGYSYHHGSLHGTSVAPCISSYPLAPDLPLSSGSQMDLATYY